MPKTSRQGINERMDRGYASPLPALCFSLPARNIFLFSSSHFFLHYSPVSPSFPSSIPPPALIIPSYPVRPLIYMIPPWLVPESPESFTEPREDCWTHGPCPAGSLVRLHPPPPPPHTHTHMLYLSLPSHGPSEDPVWHTDLALDTRTTDITRLVVWAVTPPPPPTHTHAYLHSVTESSESRT